MHLTYSFITFIFWFMTVKSCFMICHTSSELDAPEKYQEKFNHRFSCLILIHGFFSGESINCHLKSTSTGEKLLSGGFQFLTISVCLGHLRKYHYSLLGDIFCLVRQVHKRRGTQTNLTGGTFYNFAQGDII